MEVKDANHNPRIHMIFDAILFNGEYDLLEIRLNILNDFVDQFIIVEAPVTFSGKLKPLYFEKHKSRYAPWIHKIKYHIAEYNEEMWEEARVSPNTGGVEHWMREFAQRECIKEAMTHLSDEDICYIGDCDEIWKPQEIGDDVYKLEQLSYSYFLNNRSSEPWSGTFATKYKNIKDSFINHLRAHGVFKLNDPTTWTGYTFLPNAGWHFSNMGGASEIQRKIESYGHQEFNTESFKSAIQQRIDNNVDYMGFRNFTMWKDESELPKYLKDNKEKYKHLWKR